MGRFYKTARPEFLDFMYELPKEAMMKGIEQTDKGINKVFDEADKASKLLDTEKLKEDDAFANARLDGFQGEIDGITNTILGDLMQYKKQGANMRGISRKIEKDLSRGGLGKAAEHSKTYAEYEKQVKANKDITPQRAKQVLEASRKSYADNGALGWVDENTYNEITPHLIAPAKHIDDNKLVTEIGAAFEKEQTAYANATADGTTVTNTSGTKLFRPLDKLEDYTRQVLVSSGWMEDRRQGLELDASLGKLEGPETVDERLKVLEEEFVAATLKAKGAVQRTAHKSLSGDPAYKGTGNDDVTGEAVEVKNNVRDEQSRKALGTIERTVAQALANPKLNLGGYSTPRELSDAILTGSITSATAYKEYNRMFPGITRNQFNFFVNAQQDKSSAYHNVTDKKVVTAFNSKDPNVPVQEIILRDSNNNITSLGKITPGKALESSEFVYIPNTGSSSTIPYNTDPNGFLLDSTGKIVEDVNKKQYKEGEADLAIQNGLDVTYGKAVTTNTKESGEQMFTTKRGPLKTLTVKKLEDNGTVSTKTTLRHTSNYFKISNDKKSYENVSFELIIDPEHLGANQ